MIKLPALLLGKTSASGRSMSFPRPMWLSATGHLLDCRAAYEKSAVMEMSCFFLKNMNKSASDSSSSYEEVATKSSQIHHAENSICIIHQLVSSQSLQTIYHVHLPDPA